VLLDGLRELWSAHPEVITDVRGVGLMIGVELRTAALAELVQLRAFERGLLVLECGESSVRVSPPLVITRDQAAAALKILAEVFGSVD
jgi:4-aminobutyrate aminotransferase